MSLTPANVRQRIQSRIDGWGDVVVSQLPYDAYGLGTDQIAHRRVAVGLLATSTNEGRQRAGAVHCKSDVRVRYGYRMKPLEAQASAYDEALDWGLGLVRRLLTDSADTPWPGPMRISFVSQNSTTDPAGEWFLGDLHFDVAHAVVLGDFPTS